MRYLILLFILALVAIFFLTRSTCDRDTVDFYGGHVPEWVEC